jgi:hypothetical protein
MDTLHCKTCEELGCPVEGMTGICPVCFQLFCFSHLNNHTHKFADLRSGKSKDSLNVSGFGRVGSYAKAKQGHYCRAHQYWAITYHDHRIEPGTMHTQGFPAVEDSPHFKTKTEGEKYLAARAFFNS